MAGAMQHTWSLWFSVGPRVFSVFGTQISTDGSHVPCLEAPVALEFLTLCPALCLLPQALFYPE
jgi:hypothetical protein